MYVDNLILEVTRRCNFKCAHCLRGPAQNLTMSTGIIDKILYRFDQINQVTFTGGEPALAVPVIEYFIRQVRARKIDVQSFYCVTNGMAGKVREKKLAMALIDLYDYCVGCCHGEEEISGLGMSRDQYHGMSNPVPAVFRALKFFWDKDKNGHIYEPLDEGYANENGIGRQSVEVHPFTLDYEYSDDGMPRVIETEFYVAANGNIFSGCNVSFNRMDEESYGNVLTDNLLEILELHCTEESTNERLALEAKEAA